MGKLNRYEKEFRHHLRKLRMSSSAKEKLNKDLARCFVTLEREGKRGTVHLDWFVDQLPGSPEKENVSRLAGELKQILQTIEGESSSMANSSSQDVDLGVVCALHSPELEMVLRTMSDVATAECELCGVRDVHTYYQGCFMLGDRKLRVVAASQSEIGMTDSAVLATKMLTLFQPKVLAMTGVAGGRKGEVKIGDVVVASESFNYQFGKVSDSGFYPDPMPERLDEGIAQRLRLLDKGFWIPIEDAWAGDTLGRPRLQVRPMACGSSVMDKVGEIDRVVGIKRSVAAVDMESYSIYRSCRLFASQSSSYRPIPIVVKGIMDLTEGKHDAARTYCAFLSAQFLFRFAFSGLFSDGPTSGTS